MRKALLSVLSAGIWISLSEFIRNEILFKSYWVNHYRSLGLEFNTSPLRGTLWLVWSFILSYLIFTLLKRFSFLQTLWLSWLMAFVMMWIVIFNLQVLPLQLFGFMIPLSIVEVLVAGIIIKTISQ